MQLGTKNGARAEAQSPAEAPPVVAHPQPLWPATCRHGNSSQCITMRSSSVSNLHTRIAPTAVTISYIAASQKQIYIRFIDSLCTNDK
jgi:hypothetical protein